MEEAGHLLSFLVFTNVIALATLSLLITLRLEVLTKLNFFGY